MPYRGTNAKRKEVHAKSANTLRNGAKTHYHDEKKELEHELSQHKARIEKLLNDGYQYDRLEERGAKTVVHFRHQNSPLVQLEFAFTDNVKSLKQYFNN